jgi:hypothetical protein
MASVCIATSLSLYASEAFNGVHLDWSPLLGTNTQASMPPVRILNASNASAITLLRMSSDPPTTLTEITYRPPRGKSIILLVRSARDDSSTTYRPTFPELLDSERC